MAPASLSPIVRSGNARSARVCVRSLRNAQVRDARLLARPRLASAHREVVLRRQSSSRTGAGEITKALVRSGTRVCALRAARGVFRRPPPSPSRPNSSLPRVVLLVPTSSEPTAVRSLCCSWRSSSRPPGSCDHGGLCDRHHSALTSVGTPRVASRALGAPPVIRERPPTAGAPRCLRSAHSETDRALRRDARPGGSASGSAGRLWKRLNSDSLDGRRVCSPGQAQAGGAALVSALRPRACLRWG